MKLIYEGVNGTKIYRDGWVVYKETYKAEKEFNILSGLKHPNIIKVHEFFGNSYLMEYFEGTYMTAPCDGKLAMLKDVIEYIHSKGIKHNDLMAYNILESGSKIKIIDFGNAAPIEFGAKDVEGCKQEDWDMYKQYKLNNNRRFHNGQS